MLALKSRYATARCFTPLLHVPDFRQVFGGSDGASLPLDDQGLLRPIETIAFPGTVFEIEAAISPFILKVRTSEYPFDPLYTDSRFLEFSSTPPPTRTAQPPPSLILVERLLALRGALYIWGGNHSPGIPELYDLYPPLVPLDEKMHSLWTLKGVDCSGLLYEVSEGCTPRNTSQLVSFGTAVDIEDKAIHEILSLVRPLDLIVWKGHVIIVLDPTLCIESLVSKGVILTNLEQRLTQIQEELGRKPANSWDVSTPHLSRFVIRRWI